nr:immunoglobulin heavy chain junction region [Mus musculus]MBK4189641.1 immunoglobulin heavy chain junction region [Mus musculus]MBK4189642.1 immunoglobulin heavy chain junction region [Mus musculus]MBK4189643.1 immunoglobulin heavy chain junction region [Mus musculus]
CARGDGSSYWYFDVW